MMHADPPQLDTSVRGILARYPQAREVLRRHGLLRCGRSAGSDEPLGAAAAVHRVDPQGLLAELRAAIGMTRRTPRLPVAGERRDTYRLFIITALIIGLTSGFTLGAGLVLGYVSQTWLRGWLPHAQVHGHTQVWGWTLLFAAGVLSHVLPRLKAAPAPERPALVVTYALLLAGLLARTIGQPLADQPIFAALLLASGPLEVAGVTLFVLALERTRQRSIQPREPFDGYLDAALRWLWLGTALEAWASISAARSGALLLPGGWHDAALVAMLWGFTTLLIAALSVRVVPMFLRLPPPRWRPIALALPLLNLGVALSVAVPLTGSLGVGNVAGPLATVGAVALVVGVVALAHGLHLCPLSQLRAPLAPGTAFFGVFIRAGYLWLIVAAALALAQAVAGLSGEPPGYFALNGARHALTLGFITMMIFGMASRLLAAFSGHPWYSTRWLWLSFAMLNASALLRTILQPTLGYDGAGWLLALGAVLGLLSFVLFAVNALLTLAGRGRGRARHPADG